MIKKVLLLGMVLAAGIWLWPSEDKKPAPPNMPNAAVEMKKKPVAGADSTGKAKKEVVEPKKDAESRGSHPAKANTASLKPDMLPVIGTATEAKVLALTFDHSWGNKFTPSILDTLKQNNLKVTFFIMGPWAVHYPEVVKRMVADGHEIASHGYRHEDYGEKTAAWIKEDLTKSASQIKEASGITPHLFRPPNGNYSPLSLKISHELGYKSILWNIDSLDWTNPGRDVIIERVVKRLKPGAIVLMHASDTPQQTAEALPILLAKIKAAGYRVVTVSELLERYSEKGILKDE